MTISVRHVSANTWELSFRSNARVERAFEYLVAFERHVEWEEQLTEVERLRAAHGAAGASYVKTYGARPAGLLRRLFWRPVRVDCTITAVERPKLIAWGQQLWRDQPSEGYYWQDVEVRITPDGDGCRVTFTRHLMPDDSFSLATVTKAYGFIQSRLGQLPPE